MLKAIESGAVKLSVEKSGKMMAQIRDANGRYGEKLPIRKEYFKKGIDSAQMANALQMQALQEQLSQITDQIQVINHSVVRVLEGQQNDRIAQYYSGLALYAESRLVTDSAMQKALVAQSLKALAEATFELTLTMQSDIKHLANRDGKHVKGKRIEYIDEHMQLREGRAVEFDYDFVDHNLNSFDWWKEKHRGYAKREAMDGIEIMRELKNGASVDVKIDGQAALKRRQKYKYYKLPPYFRAFVYFCIRYFLKRGFLDGHVGWRWHFWQGLWYRWIVDREIARAKRKGLD